MAKTDFGALEPLKKIKFLAYISKAGRDSVFFLSEKNGFRGKNINDATKPVHYVDKVSEAEGGGTKCIMPLVLDLVGDGVVNDNLLEGNEEELVADFQEIEISQIRNACKNAGRLSGQQTVIKFRGQAKDKLSFWKGNVIDEIMFLIASGVPLTRTFNGGFRDPNKSQWTQMKFASQISAPSAERVMFGGAATSVATLTNSDTMKWALLLNLKAMCIIKRIKPIRVEGKDTYAVVMSPYQSRDLKLDPDYKNAVQSADERGKGKNSLFNGSFVMVDGLILHTHNKVFNTNDMLPGAKYGAAGNVEGAQALCLGAQALGYAEIGSPTWDETDFTDYGNKSGISYSCMFGAVKAVFKSLYDKGTRQDFSVVALYTAARK